jgi:hypothetical protein
LQKFNKIFDGARRMSDREVGAHRIGI